MYVSGLSHHEDDDWASSPTSQNAISDSTQIATN